MSISPEPQEAPTLWGVVDDEMDDRPASVVPDEPPADAPQEVFPTPDDRPETREESARRRGVRGPSRPDDARTMPPRKLARAAAHDRSKIAADDIAWIAEAKPHFRDDCRPEPVSCPWCGVDMVPQLVPTKLHATGVRAKTVCSACDQPLRYAASRPEKPGHWARHVPGDLPEIKPGERGEYVHALRRCRPCVFVSCRHTLYLDVNPEVGSVKFNFPLLEPEDMPPDESCSLDRAEAGEATLDRVGDFLNITRERARQLEVRGLMKIKGRGPTLLGIRGGSKP